MDAASRRRVSILLVVVLLALAVINCARTPRTIDPELLAVTIEFAPTRIPVQVETELAAEETATVQSTSALTPFPSATPTIAGVVRVEDDFSQDRNTFSPLAGTDFSGDGLLFGPLDICIKDRPGLAEPIGCVFICTACGAEIEDYHLILVFEYASGVSEREFGVILNLQDPENDGLLGQDDILLMLGFNFFSNEITLYQYRADYTPFLRLLETKDAGFRGLGLANSLEVIHFADDHRMDIILNDRRIFKLTDRVVDPGQTEVDPWFGPGKVGLILLDRGVQARFNDFFFTNQVDSAP